MPCMCGATDCRSCGPAQGYEVVRRYDRNRGGWVWINPEDEDEESMIDQEALDDMRFEEERDRRNGI